jgi:hypothetical protein
MERQATHRIAAILTEATTRRGALRLLAAAAITGAESATFGAATIEAKKPKSNGKGKEKSKGKDKGKQHGKSGCGHGKALDRVKVPHDGTTVQTAELEAGKSYRIRVSGQVTGTTSLLTPIAIDAGYIYRLDSDPSLALDVYGDADMGLSVDGAAATWGDYAADHVYEREIVGQGQRLSLRVVTKPEDALQTHASTRRIITVFDYNFVLSGSLTVEVLCA